MERQASLSISEFEVFFLTDQVLPTPEQAVKPIEQVEDEIVGYVKETRRALRAARKHG